MQRESLGAPVCDGDPSRITLRLTADEFQAKPRMMQRARRSFWVDQALSDPGGPTVSVWDSDVTNLQRPEVLRARIGDSAVAQPTTPR
jgi:hypothetical protein